MIKLTYTKLVALLCLVLSLGVITSCEKEEDPNSGKVELLSFGPTGANHGDTLRFIGNNLDKVTAIVFTGTDATVEKAAFKQQNSNLILVIVPQAAEKGYVTLKTPDGDVVSKTVLNLGVTAVLTSFTDEARPGSNITLNGEYLNWIERITFKDNKTVSNFVSKTFNQLVVTVPEDAQTGPLVIFYGGTDSLEIETTDTLTVTLPMATSFSPNPVKHAENVPITGTDMDLVRKVIVTGVSTPVTSFVSQSATQLVVQVPGGAKDGTIQLEAASGVRTTSSVALGLVWPNVTNMSPNPVDPGANLTITGTNLDLVTSITFENTSAVTSFVSQSPTQIVVAVPMGVAEGKIKMGVLNSSVTVMSADILQI
ncbi:MAG TPA: IPT/TIG domain-containing protein, partial [Flavisolibacter sp.]